MLLMDVVFPPCIGNLYSRFHKNKKGGRGGLPGNINDPYGAEINNFT